MTTIASGISKLLVFKKQVALGTMATNIASSGQYLRRTMSTLDKKKATYTSKEIRPSQQRSDFRHGVVGVDGTISGEVSVGTYQQFEESVNRSLSVTAITSGAAATTFAAATTTGASGTFTRTAGSWLTDGFKIGMVIRTSGWVAPATANNATNMYITALTATVMTVARLDKQPVVTKVAGDSVTFTEVGKHHSTAVANQTRDYYTIEHNFSDIQQSEVFTDCVITQMDVKLPGSGMMGCDYIVKGLDMTPNQTAGGYFITPIPTSGGAVLASANGLLYVNGLPVALITGMNFSVKGNHTSIGGIVGSNVEPDVFPGAVTVDGQVTVLFTDNVVRDYFLQETEVGIYCVFTTDNSATAGFKAYSFPRCKMGGANKDDGEKGLVMTMPFTALENSVNGGAGTATQAGTFVIQDSAYV